ncbi:DedA family protein [Qipengyuania sp.]|uniref:DedA family protein n=1 Tax=Qipengyuania sp. TaxID=2004515 RepID=UPI0035C7A88D
MDAFIASLVAKLGLLGIGVLMMLENVFPPMPSEAIMGASTLAIRQGTLSFWPVLIAATMGTLVGNYFWFRIGQKLGYERTKPFIERWGRWLTVEWEDVEKASVFFRKHGHWVVLVLRATPFMRTMISLPAGLAHMKLWKFMVFTAIGAAAWNALLIAGTHWLADTFGADSNIVSWLLIGILVVGVLGYLWRLATWKPRAQR